MRGLGHVVEGCMVATIEKASAGSNHGMARAFTPKRSLPRLV
jgi:hypothetical protein